MWNVDIDEDVLGNQVVYSLMFTVNESGLVSVDSMKRRIAYVASMTKSNTREFEFVVEGETFALTCIDLHPKLAESMLTAWTIMFQRGDDLEDGLVRMKVLIRRV